MEEEGTWFDCPHCEKELGDLDGFLSHLAETDALEELVDALVRKGYALRLLTVRVNPDTI